MLGGEGTPPRALPGAWRGVDAQAVPGTQGRLPGGSVHLLGLEQWAQPARCSVARKQVPSDVTAGHVVGPGGWSCPPLESQVLPPCGDCHWEQAGVSDAGAGGVSEQSGLPHTEGSSPRWPGRGLAAGAAGQCLGRPTATRTPGTNTGRLGPGGNLPGNRGPGARVYTGQQ